MDRVLEGVLTKYRADRDLHGLEDDALFESFVAYCLLREFCDDDFDPDEFRKGGPGDLGIDAAAIIINGKMYRDAGELRKLASDGGTLSVQFVVIQAKLRQEFRGNVLTELCANLYHLFSDDTFTRPCSKDIKHLRSCIEVIYEDLGDLLTSSPKIAVVYAAAGNPNQAAHEVTRKQAGDRLKDADSFSEVSVEIVGSRDLRRLYEGAASSTVAKFILRSRIEIPRMGEIDKAFLGVMPAQQFVDQVLRDPGTKQILRGLFHENVREYQQLGNPVNRAIDETLADGERRERFAVMNNGITIVARRIKRLRDRFRIFDFKIVNGCQTSYVLFFRSGQLGDAHVTIKLIESDNPDVMTDIVTATNSQTAIRPSAFRVRDPFQRELERFFSRQPRAQRLYYERRSGQYAATGSVLDDAGDVIQRVRIVTPSQLARAVAATFTDEAWKASRRAQIPTEHAFGLSDDMLVFYTAAAVNYRVSWLIRNRKLPSAFTPAKFHLMAAIRYAITGTEEILAAPPAARASLCDRILALVWDERAAERLVGTLRPALLAARDAGTDGDIDFNTVTLASYGERVKKAVLDGLPPTHEEE